MTTEKLFFDHVHIISQDPLTAADWYVTHLGGKIAARAEVRGAPQIAVAFEGATILIRGRRSGETVSAKAGLQWGTDHFGFGVAGDFDGFCRQLKDRGVVFSLDPMDFGPSLRIAFIQAPDGVSVELLQRRGAD